MMFSKRVAAAVSVLLVAGTVSVVPVIAEAAGSPNITLVKSAPTLTLIGAPIPYTLTASNAGGNPAAYNLLFRDVLPVGVSYVAGSTVPADVGDPTVIANQPAVGQTTLVWSNVADIQPGGSYALTFKATASTATVPVNATVDNVANAYVNSNPRTVPAVSATGVAVPASYTGNADSAVVTTTISAIAVSKAEPSPENELVRGVHGGFPSVYTVTVTNNSVNATNGTTVTDYVPANLEFLGCGGVDNTPGGVPEYPGSGLLTSVPLVAANCPAPTSVTTVNNPAGQPAGVYTQVVWTTGNLAPGQVVTINYKAGFPLRANVFPGAAGAQTANLGNNTGPSTSETAIEQSATNRVTVAGTYTGPVKPATSTSVSASTALTVTAEDFAIDKGPNGSFAQGGITTWSLRLRTGEYRAMSAMTVTDVLPDGMCPLGSANFAPGSPAECDPVGGQNPSQAYAAAPSVNPDGTTTVTFAVASLTAGQTFVITFPARERATYNNAGVPTVGGDNFVNNVTTSGTSNPIAGSPDPAPPVTVLDDSSAVLTSSGPSIDKQISTAVPPPGPLTCAGATFFDPTTTPDTRPAYENGDRICFKLRVDFPANNQTRNPQITDFLPTNLRYEAGSATTTANNTVPVTFNEAAAAANTADPTWLAGTSIGANKFVNSGDVFEVTFSATLQSSAVSATYDVLGNIMKVRAENSAGTAYSLRDQVDFKDLSGPRLSILKGVAGIAPPYNNGPNVDNVSVRTGTVVRYRLDITNNGLTSAQSVEVRDKLAAGITCADVSNISDGGTCAASSGGINQPVVVWHLSAADVIAVGTTRAKITYDVTMPPGISVTQSFTNTAGILQYESPTNVGGTVTYVPPSNIDPTSTATPNTPAATDTSVVTVPPQTLVKTHTTSLTEAGNSANQATVGEVVTWTLTATMPANTTVYDGVLNDPIIAGQTYVGGSAVALLDGGALPGGFTLSTPGAAVTLTGPAAYSNLTAAARVFTVTFQTTVDDVAVNTRPANRTNTATLNSKLTAGGTAVPTITATNVLPIVEPNLAVTKANDAPGGVVQAGLTVTYTINVTNTNAANVSTAHDTTASDVLPSGVTYVPGSASNGGVYTPATRTIDWTVGDLAAGATATRTYQVTIDPGAVSGSTYVNAVTAITTSLPGAVAGERTYTKTTSNTITVVSPQTTKTVTPGSATIGDLVTFTVTSTVPANVTVFDPTIIDTLPAGLTYVATTGVTCSLAVCPATIPADFRQNGQRLGWYFGDPAESTSAYTLTVVFTARIDNIAGNVAGTNLVNTATLRWGSADQAFPAVGLPANAFWDRATNTASATATVIEPALTVAKVVDSAKIEPGQTRTYTLTVTNSGTSPGYAATVTDVVPNGLIASVGAVTGGGSASIAGATPTGGGTITWTLPGPVAVGAPQTLTYTVVLAASSTITNAQAFTNNVQLPSYAGLPGGPGVNGRAYVGNATSKTINADFPKVTVTKTTTAGAKSGTAFIGSSFGWKLVVTNTSTATAYNVTAADTLPANWTYDAGSATVTPQGGATTQVEPTIAGQLLTWGSLGIVPAGKTVTINFAGTPGAGVITTPGVGPANPHVNSAVPSAKDQTGAAANATGSYAGPADTATAVVGSADLAIVKTHVGSFTAGQNGTYTVTVTDNGPSDAATLTVTDTVPAGFTFLSGGSINGWSACSAVGQVVTCTRAAGLLNGTTTIFPVTVSVAASVAAGSYDNVATVSSPTYDPVPGNNTSTDPTTVITRADLAVVKAVSGPVVAGNDVSWTITVTNNGPSVSRGPITVADTLPAGTSYVSATGTGWVCGVAAGVVTCTRASDLLVATAAPQITLTVHLAPTSLGSLANSATVTGTTTDPVPGNNSSTVTTPITTRADLALTKSHTGSFLAGALGTYSFAVDNLGSSTAAANLTVSDSLPVGLTFNGDGGEDGWSCSAVGQLVTCTRATTLAAGASTTFTMFVNVASGQTAPLVNTGTVSSPTTDPVPGNNTSTDNTSFTTQADLGIVKTHLPATVAAGDDVTYSLVVTNNGASDEAGPVTVVDLLPAGFTLVSVPAAAGWACPFAVGDTSLTCTHAAGLVAGATATTITLVVAVDPGQAAGPYDNHATVAGTTPDPDATNNTATDPTPVVTQADLALVKTVADATLAAGQGTAFTLAVTDNGPSDAAGPITATDTLPAGMDFVSGGGSNGWAACTSAGQVVTCVHAAGLAAGASAGNLVIAVTVQAGTPAGTLTNSAVVSSPTTDPVPANNTDTADVAVTTSADLSIVKTHRESNLQAGQTVTFDLAVSNAGPSDAGSPLTVTDTLPGKVRFVSAAAPWSCTASGDPLVGQALVCTLTAGLAAGASAPTLTVLTSVDPDLPSGVVTNTATVSSPTSDPNPGNDTDTDAVPVGVRADLAIVKAHTGIVVIGSPATYTLSVTNAGPSVATNVVVDDALPAGLGYVSATGAGWDCSTSTATAVHCTRPDALLTTTYVITVIVDVTAPAFPSVSNTATVGSDTPDPVPGNNSSTDVVAVPALVDLEVAKTHTSDFVVGQSFDYTVTVTNNGPTDDPSAVTVTDVLPAGLTFVSGTGAGWICTAVGQTVTCNRLGQARSAPSSFTLTVEVGPAAAPGVTNTAMVSTSSTETDLTNNVASDPTVVVAAADLALSKTISGTLVAGGTATYVLAVSNAGPSVAQGPLVVTDNVPKTLLSPKASGPGWTCQSVGQLVTCTSAGPLAIGAQAAAITLTATVAAAAGHTVSNSATVGGGTFDPNPGNNSSAVAGLVLAAGSGSHPHTGADYVWLLGFGLAALLAGALLVRTARRPRR